MSISQFPTINMKVRRFATQLQYSMIALVLMNVCPSRALAQDGHSHTHDPAKSRTDAGPTEQAERPSQNCPGIDRALQGCDGGRSRGVSPFNSAA